MIFHIFEPLVSFSFLGHLEKGGCVFLLSEIINKVLDYEIYEVLIKVYFTVCFLQYP